VNTCKISVAGSVFLEFRVVGGTEMWALEHSFDILRVRLTCPFAVLRVRSVCLCTHSIGVLRSLSNGTLWLPQRSRDGQTGRELARQVESWPDMAATLVHRTGPQQRAEPYRAVTPDMLSMEKEKRVLTAGHGGLPPV
jgi:hypothetical protein